MNAHGKPQDDIAKSDKRAREMIGKLDAVDQRMTPKHVAQRFQELLETIGDNSPNSATVDDDAAVERSGTVQARPPQAVRLIHAGSPETGYRTSTTAAVAGVTPRQLAYWARTELIAPSVQAAHGSGSQRLYSLRDVLVLKVVKRLLDTGISLQQIRVTVRQLRDHGTEDLAQVTLMSDGVSVYECTSPDEIVSLLASGQGVFGIALDRVWQEVLLELAELPATQQADSFVVAGSAITASAAGEGGLEKSFLRRSG